MKKGYWAIVTIESGHIGEKVKYWTAGEIPPQTPRQKREDARKQLRNDSNTARHLARIINTNWPTNHGYTLALTYDQDWIDEVTGCIYDPDAPEQWDIAFERADHQMDLWLRRCRRAAEKAGIEFRYLAFTSDLTERKGEVLHCRVHHHVVVAEDCLQIAQDNWHFGSCEETQLKAEPDHTSMAEYFVRQMRRVSKNEARYVVSRNLKKPKVSSARIAPSGKEVQPPKGAWMLYRAPYQPGQAQYIRYVLPKKEAVSDSGERLLN